jgi:hypothetical protein
MDVLSRLKVLNALMSLTHPAIPQLGHLQPKEFVTWARSGFELEMAVTTNDIEVEVNDVELYGVD